MYPKGAPCNIIGTWNSELIGLRFDIANSHNNVQSLLHSASPQQQQQTTNTDYSSTYLEIKLSDHRPPKRNTLMDTEWQCHGNTLHNIGGPFYISATKKQENILATFTGN